MCTISRLTYFAEAEWHTRYTRLLPGTPFTLTLCLGDPYISALHFAAVPNVTLTYSKYDLENLFKSMNLVINQNISV